MVRPAWWYSERKEYERQLEFQATHDGLTGLLNRHLFKDRMDQALRHAMQGAGAVAVLLLDLDHFRMINDTLGHQVGDEVLVAMAERLVSTVGVGDSVARHSGDEFMVLIRDAHDFGAITRLCSELAQALHQPLLLRGHEVQVSTSMGISLFPRDGTDTATLLGAADSAMYRAKQLGRDRFEYFEPSMNARMLEHLSLGNQLRRAAARGELRLVYQPQVDLREWAVVGVEALVRWQHPELGLLPPGRFIAIAEDLGLIGAIGEWVLQTACVQAAAWEAEGLAGLSMAVNVSPLQLLDEGFPRRVAEVLAQTGVHPARLELELTETALMAEKGVTEQRLRELKELGVKLSVDDFGTGYSSLNRLKNLPFDKLKIDYSFVRNLATDPHDAALVRTIVAMAESLGLRIIAEGVETEAQLGYLQRHRCPLIQGYYFGRPMPAGEIAALVRGEVPLPGAEQRGRNAPPAILLVDDEVNVIRALQRLLRRERYRTLAARGADEALALLAQH